VSQVTILAQIVSLLPRDSFKKLTKRHKADKHAKGITPWDHLVSMLFCHLSGAESLRDISNGLRSTMGNRKHMGMNQVPSKSSLSYLNEHRHYNLFKDYYFEVYDSLKVKGLPKRLALKNTRRKIFLVDASVISLSLRLYDWAQYRTQKGGIKLHTALNFDGLLPVFCDVTVAKTHEIKVARTQQFPKGSVLVFDKGYTDFSWWKDLDSKGIFFITRAKDNLDYRIQRQFNIPNKDKRIILSDTEVVIGSTTAKKARLPKLRKIRFWDKDQGREFEFITNQFSWTAADVAMAYKHRWHIEVFFKHIKQHCNIKSFVGLNLNAVMIQIWTSMIVYLLLKYLQNKAKYAWHLSNLSRFLRLASFAKMDLFQWLDHPFEIEKPPPDRQQLLAF